MRLAGHSISLPRSLRRGFCIGAGLALLLTACSSGVKDYSTAATLDGIDTRVQVAPLWMRQSNALPFSSHTQYAPVLDADTLYYIDVQGAVTALDADSGAQRWRVMTERLSGSPGVGAGLVIVVTRKAEVLALDAASGATRWSSRISSEVLSQPQVIANRIIMQASDGKIYALDAGTGNTLWNYSHTVPSLTLRGTSSPRVVGNRVIAGFDDGRLVALNIDSGELQWEATLAVSRGRTDLERLVDIDGLFSSDQDVIYVSSYQGKLSAVSASDGSIIWSRDLSSYTGVTLGNNQIYVSDSEGRVWAFDQRSGETLWRQDKLAGRELTLPMAMKNTVVVGDYDGYLHWLARDNGDFIARQSLDQAWAKQNLFRVDEIANPPRQHRSLTAPLLVAGDRIFVHDNLGAIAAMRLQDALADQ